MLHGTKFKKLKQTAANYYKQTGKQLGNDDPNYYSIILGKLPPIPVGNDQASYLENSVESELFRKREIEGRKIHNTLKAVNNGARIDLGRDITIQRRVHQNRLQALKRLHYKKQQEEERKKTQDRQRQRMKKLQQALKRMKNEEQKKKQKNNMIQYLTKKR